MSLGDVDGDVPSHFTKGRDTEAMQSTLRCTTGRALVAGLALAIPIGIGTGVHAVASGAGLARPAASTAVAAQAQWSRVPTAEPAATVPTPLVTSAAGPVRAAGRAGHG